MSSVPLHFRSIAELGGMIARKEISPIELTRAHLERITTHDANLNSFITVMADQAMSQAEKAESEIASGSYRGPMHGIPIGVKDIIYTRGVLTSAGSKVMADHVPTEDSTIVERLDDSGAVLLGKLNLSEFAIGGTINHPFGTPRNPWNLDHTAGGSSSGSAVAVASGLCAGALGSDTGGSIRGPSSFCGLVGIRPTYGRVTRHGVVPMCWDLDTIGPMTRTVKACAIMLRAIAGRDKRDRTSSDQPVPDYLEAIESGVRGLRIAVPTEMMEFEGLDSETRDAVRKTIAVYEELGATVDEVSLPTCAHSGAIFIAIADAEAASFHADWLRSRAEDYDWNTRTRLESATLTPAVAHIRAQRARALVHRELMETLANHDVIVMPTGPSHAPAQAEATGEPGGYYQGRMDLGRRRYTSPAPLAGLPAISVPSGFSQSGLPLGTQIIGKPFAESTLLRVAYAYEQASEWHSRHPEI